MRAVSYTHLATENDLPDVWRGYQGPGPVSYTHLDVYKRQAEIQVALEAHLRQEAALPA